ncbi:hypothetical protein PPL_02034 [Heterostelium album PN500]|uniref:Peptidase M66 domain-containing protein n=1 Tax=Heterostelium pallidum (strain ATCC 26659 / Pp 5 / PN500) TaxID=670386 RepID=D3B164_HETP5|nr:hypothetical protein PPL_02034 [Heterostelium album PN500]EFA85038.1 hypothetical protein PPL_02034 [Heterostelium album PN500]|eukprot:XP_020437148.1 hypothetical protein PPL_02034 [Heterostelium album PN500]
MKRYHFSIFLFCIVLALVDGKLVSRECDMACPDEYICCQPLKYLPPKCVPICKFVDCPAGKVCRIINGDFFCVAQQGTTLPITTSPATTTPATTTPATTAPATTAPATTRPSTTTPATTSPATTAPAITRVVTTAPATTAPATTGQATTAPATTRAATTAPATTAPATTAPATTAPATTAPATTAPATTAPATTAPATTAPVTTAPATTAPATTAPATAPATTAPATTAPATTAPATTGTTAPATTAPATTGSPTTTSASATTGAATTSTTPTNPNKMIINSFKGAQSHVIPAQGHTWTLPGGNQNLHFVGNRTVLGMFDLSSQQKTTSRKYPILSRKDLNPVPANLVVNGIDKSGNRLGSVPLTPPDQFPGSELNQDKYSTTLWTAKLPKEWLAPKLSLSVSADGNDESDHIQLNVGAPSDYFIESLPIYLYGATPQNSVPIHLPNDTQIAEVLQKLPVDYVKFDPHPYNYIQWKQFPIAPDGNRAGYLAKTGDDEKNMFDFASAYMTVMRGIRLNNGDQFLTKQIYSPMIKMMTNGSIFVPNSGVGGIDAGVSCGDYQWGPLFMHETGHAFGLWHCVDSISKGLYPYVGGSLLGSEWGWDADKNLMLIPFMPNGSCPTPLNGQRAVDKDGRCYKQDPMQDGGGGYDRSRGLFNYATFADWSVSTHQKWFESRWSPDANSPNGFSQWNNVTLEFDPANITQHDDGGFTSIEGYLPIQKNIPVYSVVVSFSLADPSLSMILEPIKFVGNLIRTFDPTDPTQLAEIIPQVAKYPFYCYRGCDYTLKMTYADGTSAYRILNSSFRGFGQVSEPIPPESSNPINAESFKYWVMHFPADKVYTKIELLSTPQVFNGLPALPQVLLAYP